MKSPNRSLLTLPAIGLALALIGCNAAGPDSDASVEISSQAAGNSVAAYFSEGMNWGEISAMHTDTDLQALTHEMLQSENSASPLSKSAAELLNDNLQIDLSDTAKGVAYVYFTHSSALLTRHDTAEVVWDDKARDDIKDNENIIRAISHTRYQNGREDRVELTDGDGDGILIDKTSPASVVSLELVTTNPRNKPFVQESRVRAKIRILADNAGDEPVAFFAEEIFKNGRVHTIRMENALGEEEIIKGDTLRVIVETQGAPRNDSLRSMKLIYTLNPGQDLKDESDNSLYSFSLYARKSRGAEREAEFHFIADKPVPHGQEPESGAFNSKLTYANGKSVTLAGSFSPEGFEAVFTGPEGGSKSISITRSGEVSEGATEEVSSL